MPPSTIWYSYSCFTLRIMTKCHSNQCIKMHKCLVFFHCDQVALKETYRFAANIWGCVYSSYPIILWWLWEYVYFILSYHHHPIRSVTHFPLFRVTLWNTGMCCVHFYILTILNITQWPTRLTVDRILHSHKGHLIPNPRKRATDIKRDHNVT